MGKFNFNFQPERALNNYPSHPTSSLGTTIRYSLIEMAANVIEQGQNNGRASTILQANIGGVGILLDNANPGKKCAVYSLLF